MVTHARDFAVLGSHQTYCGTEIDDSTLLSEPSRPLDCERCLLAMLPLMAHGATRRSLLIRALAARDGTSCTYCECLLYTGQPLPRGEHEPACRHDYVLLDGKMYRFATVDHYIPKASGGSDRGSNLVLSCYDCNQRKAATLPTLGDAGKVIV